MTAEERKMLNMTEEEFKKFEKNNLMSDGYFLFSSTDYIEWLKKASKNRFVIRVSTVKNKREEGVLDYKEIKDYYPVNNGVTQGGKEKKKYPIYIVMNKKTMSYMGYNDGTKGSQGKPITSTKEKKDLAKRMQEEREKRGVK